MKSVRRITVNRNGVKRCEKQNGITGQGRIGNLCVYGEPRCVLQTRFSDGTIQCNAQTDIVVRDDDAKYKRYISLYKRKSI